MYDVLDRYITEFSKEGYSEDYWYDVAVVHAIQLIDDLNEEDWLLLMEHIDEKDLLWKKRLVYCLGDHSNKNELNVILKIMDTEDEELFVMCVDALKGMVTEDNREKISCSKNINKALGLIPKSGVATKDVLQSFVQGWISEYPVRTAD